MLSLTLAFQLPLLDHPFSSTILHGYSFLQ